MATERSVMAVIRAARPSFRHDKDRIAFAIHSFFVSSGFALISCGPPAFAPDALSTSSTDEVSTEHWNEFEDEYAFIYLNPDKKNQKVLVKCLVMGDKLLVDALSGGAAEPTHIEIKVNDYIGEATSANYSEQFKDLGRLVDSLNFDILGKLYKPPASASSSQPSERANNVDVPESMVTVNEDYDSLRVPARIAMPPIDPLGGGGSDLLPGPGAGVYPTRGDFGGGSMLIGMDDPRWSGGMAGQQPGYPGTFGGMPPPGGVPGARFDPYGPPGVPGFEPDRFRRLPRGGRGTHPDMEQPGGGGFDYI